MDTPACDIVFSGVLLTGRDPAQVRAELARLFKTDAAGIERLFCGRPVIIKKGVDRQTADKYRAALEKAGASCEIRACVPAGKAADVPGRMAIAPAGALLTTPRETPALAFDLGHMSLAAAGVDILEDDDITVAPPAYDLSALSVAPPGSELVAAVPLEPASLPDIGTLSLAEAGSELDARVPAAVAALPDISRITLAPAGAAILKPDEMKPRPAVSAVTGSALRLAPP